MTLRPLLLACALVMAADAAAQTADTAQDVAPLARVIAVDLRDVPLRDALEHVARTARLRLSYSPDMLPQQRVTLVHERISAEHALRQLLAGTELDVLAPASGLVVLAPQRARVVRGRVIDAVSGSPLAGVTVTAGEGAAHAVTDGNGRYTLPLPPAAAVVSAEHFGYRPTSALIPAGAADRTHDLALAPVALSLERLDVIGPRIVVAEHEPAHSVTTLRPARLSPVQPRTFGEVLRAGAGMLALPGSAPSPQLRVTGLRGATSLALSPPKVYVDGVELAQPQYAGALDPAMIERVDVVRGPQGAALYGSDAIGGVVDIVTRKGTPGAGTGTRMEFRSAAGTMQSALNAADLLVVDEFIGLSHTGTRTAGSVAASVLRHGTSAEAGGTRLGVYAGGRAAAERLSAEASVQMLEHTWRPAVNDVLRALGHRALLPGLDQPQQLQQSMAGVTLRLLAAPGWTHTLTAGRDHIRLDVNPERMPALSPPDSLVGAARGVSERLSVRYTSVLRRQLDDFSSAVLTTGAEASRLRHTSHARAPAGAVGLPATETRADMGAFARFDMLVDRLMLSAGLRAEHSSAFGTDHGLAWLPAIGATWSTHAGPVDVRWRAAWGRAIRPAWPTGLASRTALPVLGNPNLRPEEQHGTESGVDLELDTRAALRLTRFDQTVDDLVQDVLTAGGSRTTVVPANVGSIRNTGWEAELSLSLAAWGLTALPLSLAASHSVVDSRVQGLTHGYTGELRPGDRVPEVPASATSLTLAFDDDRTGVAFTAFRVGAWQSYDWLAIYRERQHHAELPSLRDFRIDYAPLLRFDLGITHQLSPRFAAVFRIENLMNVRRGGRDNLEPAPGRGLSLGVQVH